MPPSPPSMGQDHMPLDQKGKSSLAKGRGYSYIRPKMIMEAASWFQPPVMGLIGGDLRRPSVRSPMPEIVRNAPRLRTVGPNITYDRTGARVSQAQILAIRLTPKPPFLPSRAGSRSSPKMRQSRRPALGSLLTLARRAEGCPRMQDPRGADHLADAQRDHQRKHGLRKTEYDKNQQAALTATAQQQR